MANHKSAEKRARQTVRRQARNSMASKKVKTAERKLVDAVKAKSQDIQTLLRNFTAEVMKAVSKGVLKKETASRKISRMSRSNHRANAQATS